MPMQSFLPALPPSVVPPRISAPYPCTFPHSAVYEHPTRPTVVTFTVTAQGRVTNASIVQSSGSGVVDEAVRNCVSGFIYAPAMHDGAPIDVSWAYEYNLTITGFRAPPALPPDAPQGTKFVMMPVEIYRSGVTSEVGCESWHQNAPRGVLVAFDVEPDGSVKNASVAQSSGDAAVDKDAVDCVSRREYKPATRDGEPVEIRLTAELFGTNRE
jgi:TonB family protein